MEAYKKRWRVKNLPTEQSAVLRKDLNIHPLICGILTDRVILDYPMAKAFFRPSWNDLHDPLLMKDMQQAVERIMQAVSTGEKILIYG
ncbi:MAG: single-stranded-DNA-specific exonuclease RecJ, partial [Bacteroidota bacterium]